MKGHMSEGPGKNVTEGAPNPENTSVGSVAEQVSQILEQNKEQAWSADELRQALRIPSFAGMSEVFRRLTQSPEAKAELVDGGIKIKYRAQSR